MHKYVTVWRNLFGALI